jgi:hypothetical protein
VIELEFDISSISAIVAAVGVIIGIVFALLELRHLRRERETDLLVKMAPWLNMDSGELLKAYVKVLNLEFKDYDEFVKKYGSPLAEKPEQMAIMTMGNYFEAIGALLKRKLLNIDLVWDYWGETFIMLCEKLKPYGEGVKKEFNQPKFGDSTEYLYNEMKKREQCLSKTQ